MHNELQDVMGQSFGVPEDVDEEELMGELDALEDELAMEAERPAGAGGVPAYMQARHNSRLAHAGCGLRPRLWAGAWLSAQAEGQKMQPGAGGGLQGCRQRSAWLLQTTHTPGSRVVPGKAGALCPTCNSVHSHQPVRADRRMSAFRRVAYCSTSCLLHNLHF